jgi:hypothetical protein
MLFIDRASLHDPSRDLSFALMLYVAAGICLVSPSRQAPSSQPVYGGEPVQPKCTQP